MYSASNFAVAKARLSVQAWHGELIALEVGERGQLRGIVLAKARLLAQARHGELFTQDPTPSREF